MPNFIDNLVYYYVILHKYFKEHKGDTKIRNKFNGKRASA
jgi:hypothetical protein